MKSISRKARRANGGCLMLPFGGRNQSISHASSATTVSQGAREYTAETITLKSGNNNLFGCGFLIIFGAIWNGIVFTILWNMVSEGEIGADNLLPLLFMVPFVLIGIAVLVALVYVFLSLFNPKPDLTLTPGYLPLGGAARLGWTFRGSPGRIRHFTLTLTGEEKATYRRGTSSVTDTSTFHKTILFETTVPGEMPFGEVQFTIPEFTAPSFDAPNNKITWNITVHGDIRRWPDVKVDFPITVSPLPLAEGLVIQPAEFKEV